MLTAYVYAKKIIIHGQHIETLRKIQEKLAENAVLLVQNAYGNYAIQIAFENWSGDFCLPIIQQFYGKFYNLSMQKYSSNVVEKCLERGDENVLGKFIDEISQHTRVLDLMKNSYGNYVVQKALKLSKDNNKTKFVNCIMKNLDKFSDKKLINKWKGIVNNSQHLNFGNNMEMNLNLSGLNNSGSSNNSARENKPSNLLLGSPNFFSPVQMQFSLTPTNNYSRSLIGSPNRPNNNMMNMNMIYNTNNYFPQNFQHSPLQGYSNNNMNMNLNMMQNQNINSNPNNNFFIPRNLQNI